MQSKLASMPDLVRNSVLQCPECGHAERLEMPVDACIFFHACNACGVILRPKAGDCCVFCSYGSVPCPPEQARRLSRSSPAQEAGGSTPPMLDDRGCCGGPA